MKRICALVFCFSMLFLFAACSAAETPPPSEAPVQTEPAANAAADAQPSAAQTEQEGSNVMQISVTDSQEHEVVFALNDSSAAKALYAQLPLRVEVENYSTNEKIFYPEPLDVSDTPAAGVEVGTLAYYAPWGDVVMFYDTYRANPSLYELGRAVSGAEQLRELSGTLDISAK